MKKLMRGNADELVEAGIQVLPGKSDCRAVRVLHSPATGRFGEVINEHVILKWAVAHPCGLGRNNALNWGNDFLEGGLSIVSINDHAIFSAGRIKVFLAEVADFNRRVDKLIVVGRRKNASLLYEWRSNFPPRGGISKFNFDWV